MNSMRRNALGIATGIGLSAMTLGTAHADIPGRKGFLIGFAGGLGSTHLDIERDAFAYQDDGGVGVSVKLMIGGGVTDRVAITGTFIEQRDSIDDSTYNSYLLGVTGTVWLSAGRPSAYGSLTLGRQSLLSDVFDLRDERENRRSATGDAARIAVGYEFANRMHAELGATFVDAAGFERDSGDVRSRQLQLLAGWHWY